MAREPSIFDQADPEANERALREGEADADAGRVVSHEEVCRWLLTWGTPEAGPPPEHWFADR